MPFHFEQQVPDAAGLPLPSGAGEALPIDPGGFGLDVSPIRADLPNPYLTAADAVVADPTWLGLTEKQRDWVTRLAAGIEDATLALHGKQGTAVSDLLKRRRVDVSEERAARTEERAGRTEERKAKVEEERLGLERGRFGLEQIREARAIRTQELTEGRVFLNDASNLASRLITIPDQGQRAAAMNAMVQEARNRGGDRLATIVHGILQQPDVGRMIGPLMRYLPESMTPALMQEGALLFHAGKGTDAVAKAEVLAVPQATNDLFARMQVVKNALGDQYKNRPIPLSLLEAAVEAANPGDPKGTNPELNLLRGIGEVFSKAQPRIKEALGDAGFEVPGVKAKVAERIALIPAEVAETAAKELVKTAPELVEAQARAKAREAEVMENMKRRYAGTQPFTPSEASGARQQFLTQAKDFSDTLRAYQRVEDAVKEPSAAGDIAVLFGYMKMLDPGSVVRESEFATAQNAAGIPEQIRNTWNRLMTGKRLGDEGAPTREDIADRSRRLVQGQLTLHEQIEQTFRTIAKKRGVDADEIVPDIVGTDLRKRIKELGAKPSGDLEFVRDPKTGRLILKKK